MSLAEERMKILKMVSEGKINAQEAAELLKALGNQETRKDGPTYGAGANRPQMLRIRVVNSQSGKVKVNVTIPVSLVNRGLKMGARFAPDFSIDEFEEIMESIRNGERGRVFAVEENDETFEIYIE
ncbi:MAG: hypothetical protein GYB68_08760 [Chloroflexi bacterium]|nr:hypothetical protein [Chloroflexota bacterium]